MSDASNGARDGVLGIVVVAAGSGHRLGSAGPKALVEIAGRSLLAYALGGLAEAGLPAPLVVHGAGRREDFVRAVGSFEVARFVVGGETRTESVRRGVEALPTSVSFVVVHDAARPLMPAPVIRACVDAVLGSDDVVAAAPALAVADTLKRVVDGEVVGTVERDQLVAVQTPQVFPRGPLERALASSEVATDELRLLEGLVASGSLRGRVVVVPGSPWGHKLTFPADLAFIETLATALVARGPDDGGEA